MSLPGFQVTTQSSGITVPNACCACATNPGTTSIAIQGVSGRVRRTSPWDCGYHFEGTLRNSYLKPGVRMDTQVWSLVRSDREAARRGSPQEGA